MVQAPGSRAKFMSVSASTDIPSAEEGNGGYDSADSLSLRNPTFIVSSGRCGSTLISNLIRLHPQILSLSGLFASLQTEPFPGGAVSGREFWALLSLPRSAYTEMLRPDRSIGEFLYRFGQSSRFTRETGVPPLLLITLPHIADDAEAVFDELGAWLCDQPTQGIGDHFRQLFRWLCRRFNRLAAVERSGSSLSWLSSLQTMFPEARFVHLFRDGRDCALSMSRHHGFRLSLARGMMPGGFLMPAQRLAPETIPIEAFGRSWSEMVVRGYRQLEQLSAGQVMHLCYETLVAKPSQELRRLCEFIGVSCDDAWLATASQVPSARTREKPVMSDEQRRRLDAACSEGMRLLYGDQR